VQLLDRYDLNRGTTLKAIDKRVTLADWVERQREQGLDPAIPDDIINDASKRSYKMLTVEELRGLVDTVKSIEHLGRLKNKLLTAKKDRDFAAAVERARARSSATRSPSSAPRRAQLVGRQGQDRACSTTSRCTASSRRSSARWTASRTAGRCGSCSCGR
jgi:hypothetical protein